MTGAYRDNAADELTRRDAEESRESQRSSDMAARNTIFTEMSDAAAVVGCQFESMKRTAEHIEAMLVAESAGFKHAELRAHLEARWKLEADTAMVWQRKCDAAQSKVYAADEAYALRWGKSVRQL